MPGKGIQVPQLNPRHPTSQEQMLGALHFPLRQLFPLNSQTGREQGFNLFKLLFSATTGLEADQSPQMLRNPIIPAFAEAALSPFPHGGKE